MISMKKKDQIKAAQDEAKARQATLLEKYEAPLKRTAAQRLASRPDFPDFSTPPYHGPKLKSEGSI